MNFKKTFIIAIVYTLLISITVISAINVRNFINNPFEQIENFKMDEIEKTDGNVKFNVLIVGLDKTKTLSDVIMIVRYDEEHNRIAAMSIPRDTYVNYNGRTMLINSVYGVGGINAISRVATQLTGLTVNYYVVFSLGTFGKMVDLLGGVEFNVPQNMHYEDPVQDLYIHLTKGMQILDGEDAENLVRFRGYPQADLKRVEVQQDLLKELIKQKVNAEYITKLPSIYDELKKDIKCNISIKDMLIYGKSIMNIDFSNDIYTCTMPTMYTGVDAHLYHDRVETDKIMEKEFYTEGPIIGNDPYKEETKKD